MKQLSRSEALAMLTKIETAKIKALSQTEMAQLLLDLACDDFETLSNQDLASQIGIYFDVPIKIIGP